MPCAKKSRGSKTKRQNVPGTQRDSQSNSSGTIHAIVKPLRVPPVLPPELLDLIISNVVHARSLRNIALSSRALAAISRPYRLRILSLKNDDMCSAYIDFYNGQASDAPNLVRELRLDGYSFCSKEVHRSPEIILLLKGLRSLSLSNYSWGSILPSGTLYASRIHSLSLCCESFSNMLELDRFFSSMPALKSLSLEDDLNIGTTVIWSDTAPLIGPAIEVLRLTNVRNALLFGRVLNHGLPFSIRNIQCLDVDYADNHLEEFISKILQSQSHIEELSIKRPEVSFGEDEYDEEEEEEDEDEEADDHDTVTSDEESITDDDIGHEHNVATAGDSETQASNSGISSSSLLRNPTSVQQSSKVVSKPALLPHTLRLNLLQFDMVNHQDGVGWADADRDPTYVLRWLMRQFRENVSSLSIGTVRINISLQSGDVHACLNSSLWRDWDAELSKCSDVDGPPNVFVTLRSFVDVEGLRDEVDSDDYVARIKEDLDRISRCIMSNMQNVRTAQRLHISPVIKRPYREKVQNFFTRMTPKEMRRYLWLEAGMDIEDLTDPY